jgi:hypothetical protein
MVGVLGLESRRGLGIFLFTTASRTALVPTQPPIQWVPGSLSLGLKRPGREADHSPPSSAEVKEWVELYLHSPDTPSWRGAQLKHRDNFTFTFTFTFTFCPRIYLDGLRKTTKNCSRVSWLPNRYSKLGAPIRSRVQVTEPWNWLKSQVHVPEDTWSFSFTVKGIWIWSEYTLYSLQEPQKIIVVWAVSGRHYYIDRKRVLFLKKCCFVRNLSNNIQPASVAGVMLT